MLHLLGHDGVLIPFRACLRYQGVQGLVSENWHACLGDTETGAALSEARALV